MRNVFSWVRVISLLFFLAALLLVYAYLPERVSLYSDSLGTPVYFIERGFFFYYSFGFALLANLMFFFLNKTIERIPVTNGRGIFSSEKFKESSLVWLELLTILINIFFVSSLAFIGIYNNPQTLPWANFSYLAWFGTFLIFAGILSFGYLIRLRKHQLS